jgi:hypothetical protein
MVGRKKGQIPEKGVIFKLFRLAQGSMVHLAKKIDGFPRGINQKENYFWELIFNKR